MEVQELKKLIKDNNIPDFLIFTGQEYKVQQLYMQQIATHKDLQLTRVDNVTDILCKLSSNSLLTKKRLYVVRDDKTFMTTEKAYKDIESRLNGNILILVLSDVDKRTKFYKMYNKAYIEFNPLKGDVLRRYIQRAIALSDRNCNILMEICDYNYGHCLLEIDKLLKYGYYNIKTEPSITAMNIDMNKVFEKLLQDGTLYIPPRDTLWDFIKAFLQDKVALTYELYEELKDLETSALPILTNLYNNAKNMLQVMTCTSTDVAKTTGLTSWQIKNAKECLNVARAFTKEDLVYIMRLIQKVESGIKQGKIDESLAVEYVMVNCL